MGLINDLIVRIRGDKTQLDSTLAGAKTSVNSFSSAISKLGGIIGAVFSVRALVNFAREASRLSAEAEGVKNAFAKIGDTRLLDSLKKATRGVIEESDLMRLVIRAVDFKIPLQDLARYLEFATNKAITTNKSINELADLIVTGLGRESSLSFIQLGLAIKDTQKAFKTTHGIMKLVNDELVEMGPVMDTATIRMGKLIVASKEFKDAWGDWLNKSKTIEAVRKYFTTLLTVWADESASFAEKAKMLLPFYGNWGMINPAKMKAQRGGTKEYYEDEKEKAEQGKYMTSPDFYKNPFFQKDVGKKIETLNTLNEKLEAQREILNEMDAADVAGHLTQLQVIDDLEARIKSLSVLVTKEEKLSKLKEDNMTLESGYKLKTIEGKERGPMGLSGFVPILGADLKIIKPADVKAATEMQQAIEDMANELDRINLATDILSEGLKELFMGGAKGFEKMVDSIIRSIERLIAELIAKAIVMTVLNIITGGGVTLGTNLFKGFTGAGNAAKGAVDLIPSGGYGNLAGNFVLKGEDLYLSVQRAANTLDKST